MASSSESQLKSEAIINKSEQSTNVSSSSTNATNIRLDTINVLTMDIGNDFHHILKETGNRLLVVEFFAQWCSPCKNLSPNLERLANSYNGKILVVKVDVDEFEELTSEYNISAIPTFILMKNEIKVEQFSTSNMEIFEKILVKHVGKPELNHVENDKEKHNKL